jgi:TPR repeat protein
MFESEALKETYDQFSGANLQNIERILLDWHIKSAKMGNIDSMIKVAEIYEKDETHLDERLSLYGYASAKGNAKGMYKLGNCFSYGTGVEENLEEAFRLYKCAAIKGHIEAMLQFANALAFGRGCEKDDGLAQEWYEKAANLGSVDAMEQLGFNYLLSDNIEQAINWYSKAAVKGHRYAMQQLDDIYTAGKNGAPNLRKAFEWCKKGAEAGDVVLMERMGEKYAKGIGIGVDTNAAASWYDKTFQKYRGEALQGNRRSMFQLGRFYESGLVSTQDLFKAIYWYREAAKAGNTEAMDKLGRCYAEGRGVAKDEREAFNWYKKAAEKRNVNSMYNLGRCYAEGRGVAKDEREAFNWYKKAADRLNGDALYALGQCYAHGKGTDADSQKCIESYMKAARLDNADANFVIAVLYNTEGAYDIAFRYFRSAFDLGNMKAASFLSHMYNRGKGVEKNLEEADRCLAAGVKAEDPQSMCEYGASKKDENGKLSVPKVEWLLKAAEAGNVDAMVFLAISYLNGNGVKIDKEKGFYWLLKGAENSQGRFKSTSTWAMEFVAEMYWKGEGTRKDAEKAAYWFWKAAMAGHESAMFQLANRYSTGVGIQKNEVEAFKWYEKSAELGHSTAMFLLANCYDKGLGTQKNYIKAMEWFRRAADGGFVPAMEAMGRAYILGRGVPENDFLAYAWLGLATAKGAEDCLALRNETRERLSSEMIVKAQQLVQYWFENGTADQKDISKGNEAPKNNNIPMPKSSGTGFFVTPDGYLLTAAHVVAKTKQIKVSTSGGTFTAKVISIDEKNDIALLKVDGGPFTAISVIPSRDVKLGADVFTIGFPNIDLQGKNPKFTKGVISGLSGIQDDPTCFQISVAVQPGNSGGPLVNDSGYAIGIVVSKLNDIATTRQTGSVPQSVNYAVKSIYASPLLAMIPKDSSRPVTLPCGTLGHAIERSEKAVCILLTY